MSGEVAVRVELAHADVAAQIVRADAKAGMLLPLFGGVLAGLVALTTRSLPLVAEVFLWLAAAPALVAVLLLLSVVRPRFGRRDDYGFPFLARFAERPSEVLAALADQPGEMARAVDAVRLAVLARTKYRRVRSAVDALVVSLLLVAVALTLAAVA
ncbi:Pycsar system effector family protein [Saccharothrix deserti]|uniref:Pycsar system effector family protein n=1 Tax=Saccharothrix deserti TaxID=2593674 RepID=UPI00131E3CDC|nr:Pycsar system effector family protein [Saccharothrix deserti]